MLPRWSADPTISGARIRILQSMCDYLLARIDPVMGWYLELQDDKMGSVVKMTEEHQLAPNEYITPGPPRALFNNICAGCHGSLSGSELDIAVSADALTGASVSMSRNAAPKNPQ